MVRLAEWLADRKLGVSAMSMKIFVNLPVRDLVVTMGFFASLDFKFDPRFTNEDAACMIVGEDSYVMLLVEEYFKTFTPKDICNAYHHTEAIISLSMESREQVDEFVNRALDAGASDYKEPVDEGPMYGWGFQDINGHIWEIFYMDMSQVPDVPA